MRKTMLALAGAAVLGACDSPTIPPRMQAYDFTLPIVNGPSLVFHWPVGSEVGVYVSEPDDARRGLLSSAVDAGASAWNAAVLFDEYRLRRVASPGEAAVVVVWAGDPEIPVDTTGCAPEPGRAVTTFCTVRHELEVLRPFPLSADSSTPSRVRFVITLGSREHEDRGRLQRLVAHELGHALGIFRHSPLADDLMHSAAPTDRPSPVDRNTVQILYHTAPDLRP